MMIRSLAIVTVLCLCGTSASAALTMEECTAKYKAAQAAGTVSQSWAEFQKTQCGITPSPRPKSQG